MTGPLHNYRRKMIAEGIAKAIRADPLVEDDALRERFGVSQSTVTRVRRSISIAKPDLSLTNETPVTPERFPASATFRWRDRETDDD